MTHARPVLAIALVLAMTIASTCLLVSCNADAPLNAFDDAVCLRYVKDPESVDLLTWLKDPYGGPKRVGVWSTDETMAFAHELEARGAKTMMAVMILKVQGPPPYEEAKGLVVALPDDPKPRLSLFRLYAQAVRSRNYVPQADVGQDYLYIPGRAAAR